uniref:Saposin B-type domain-containing protein n=1 Tax=Caenorhabditis tropicalis TaxID=1561998 RepID=A0A1I7T996_9PELO
MKIILCIVGLIALATALVLPEKRASSLDCLMCRCAVNVTDPSVDDKVHNAEDQFIADCKQKLSGIPFLEQECLNYAHAELDPIINELESGTAPEDVCRKLNQCPN